MTTETYILKSGNTEIVLCEKTGKVVDLRVLLAEGKSISLLVQRPQDALAPSSPQADDIFDIRSAWGIDECFPSVAGYPKMGMRDHGLIWGSPAILQKRQNWLLTEWNLTERDIFRRDIVAMNPCDDATGRFAFSLAFPSYFNTSYPDFGCKSIFASHALFAAEAGDVLEIWDGEESEYKSTLCWRGFFPNADEKVAQKFFITGRRKLVARLFRKHLRLEIKVVCQENVPHLGIWWCNNGWGDGRIHRTIGIEPTNIASDGPIFQPFQRPSIQFPVETANFTYEISWRSE